jgi:GNAT superfamily N-acetyltransferase
MTLPPSDRTAGPAADAMPPAEVAIRDLVPADLPAVSALTTAVMHALLPARCSPAERDEWLGSLTPGELLRLAGLGVRWWVAETASGELVGAVALRDRHHLYHLYVATAWQRRGIGRRLWEVARAYSENAGAREIYVNAWPDAVAVYRRFGFAAVGPPTTYLCVVRQAMVRSCWAR